VTMEAKAVAILHDDHGQGFLIPRHFPEWVTRRFRRVCSDRDAGFARATKLCDPTGQLARFAGRHQVESRSVSEPLAIEAGA